MGTGGAVPRRGGTRVLGALLVAAAAACPAGGAPAAGLQAADLEGVLAEGARRLGRGELHAVLDDFRREEGRLGDRARFQSFLGFLCERAGRPDEALERYRRAITIDPSDPYAYGQKGALLARLRRLREAEEVYRALLARSLAREEAEGALAFIEAERGKLGQILLVRSRLRRLGALATLVGVGLIALLLALARRRQEPPVRRDRRGPACG